MQTDTPFIILFDGVCKFCHSSVQFVIKRDRMNKFVFCPIQSEKGQSLLNQYKLTNLGLTSMILIDERTRKSYTKSSAALHIARQLKMPWPLMFGFMILPRFIRDRIYDFIGNHRYQWFGEYESCWIPDDESRKKFID